MDDKNKKDLRKIIELLGEKDVDAKMQEILANIEGMEKMYGPIQLDEEFINSIQDALNGCVDEKTFQAQMRAFSQDYLDTYGEPWTDYSPKSKIKN